jgi:hypothetical protein
MCHSGHKVTDAFNNLKLDYVSHLPDSPDLSSCDFSPFGILKQKIKDRVFQTAEDIMTTVRSGWDERILEHMRSTFFNWIE